MYQYRALIITVSAKTTTSLVYLAATLRVQPASVNAGGLQSVLSLSIAQQRTNNLRATAMTAILLRAEEPFLVR